MKAGTAAVRLVRRFVGPVLLSGFLLAAIPYLIEDIAGGGRGPSLWSGRVLSRLPHMAGFFMIFTAPSILLVGLPCGYLVARLRAGLLASLLILLVIGVMSGMGVIALLFRPHVQSPAAEPYAVSEGLLILGGIPGGLTALTWTLLNSDLFRRRANGRPAEAN
jgi:ABC-type uncharacterized transport system permease subunit